jgi:hypothetical protein
MGGLRVDGGESAKEEMAEDDLPAFPTPHLPHSTVVDLELVHKRAVPLQEILNADSLSKTFLLDESHAVLLESIFPLCRAVMPIPD